MEGIVTRTSGGRYDLVRSVKGYIAYLRASPSSVEGSDGATLKPVAGRRAGQSARRLG